MTIKMKHSLYLSSCFIPVSSGLYYRYYTLSIYPNLLKAHIDANSNGKTISSIWYTGWANNMYIFFIFPSHLWIQVCLLSGSLRRLNGISRWEIKLKSYHVFDCRINIVLAWPLKQKFLLLSIVGRCVYPWIISITNRRIWENIHILYELFFVREK